jgi:hypothetical protein
VNCANLQEIETRQIAITLKTKGEHMVWERAYLLGKGTSWKNKKTGDILYTVYRTQWDVLLNTKIIYQANSEKEAIDFMDDYMMEEH